jgi:hypothetical protein
MDSAAGAQGWNSCRKCRSDSACKPSPQRRRTEARSYKAEGADAVNKGFQKNEAALLVRVRPSNNSGFSIGGMQTSDFQMTVVSKFRQHSTLFSTGDGARLEASSSFLSS